MRRVCRPRTFHLRMIANERVQDKTPMGQYAPAGPNEPWEKRPAWQAAMMQVQIEFLGLSRLITGEKIITIDLTERVTFRDLVRQLGRTYPELIGDVIQPGRDGLQPPNVFHTKDGHFIKQDQLDRNLEPDDCIVLMSLSAGG